MSKIFFFDLCKSMLSRFVLINLFFFFETCRKLHPHNLLGLLDTEHPALRYLWSLSSPPICDGLFYLLHNLLKDTSHREMGCSNRGVDRKPAKGNIFLPNWSVDSSRTYGSTLVSFFFFFPFFFFCEGVFATIFIFGCDSSGEA